MKGNSPCSVDGELLRVGTGSCPPLKPQGQKSTWSVSTLDNVNGVSGMMRFRLAGLGGRHTEQGKAKGLYYGELEGQGETITLSSGGKGVGE